MNQKFLYCLVGTYQGETETQNFKVFWWESDPILAMDGLRKNIYELGYDHVLFQHVYICKNFNPDDANSMVEIPMLQALGME